MNDGMFRPTPKEVAAAKQRAEQIYEDLEKCKESIIGHLKSQNFVEANEMLEHFVKEGHVNQVSCLTILQITEPFKDDIPNWEILNKIVSS